jgi:hypothetical protein
MMNARLYRILISGKLGTTLMALPADLTVGKSARACLPPAGAIPRPPGRRAPITSAAPSPLARRRLAPGDRPGRVSTGHPLIRPGLRNLICRTHPEAA